jgi:hypothetical protein
MSTTRKRRWIDVLRRSAGVGEDDRRGSATAMDDAALWAAHDRASASLKESGARSERVAATLARQRSQIEAVVERSSLLVARAEALIPAAARVIESFERLGVIALNAGLEGARFGEPIGRALLLVSEEVRANVSRGAEAAGDLAANAEELGMEAAEVRRQIERARAEVSDIGQEAAQLQAAAQTATKSLEDLGARMRRATGIDPEMARVVALAADHARGLMSALSSLSASAPGAPVLLALRPIIGPLVRLLGEIDARTPDSDEDEADSEGPPQS